MSIILQAAIYYNEDPSPVLKDHQEISLSLSNTSIDNTQNKNFIHSYKERAYRKSLKCMDFHREEDKA